MHVASTASLRAWERIPSVLPRQDTQTRIVHSVSEVDVTSRATLLLELAASPPQGEHLQRSAPDPEPSARRRLFGPCRDWRPLVHHVRKGEQDVVVALDAQNGKTIWEHAYSAPFSADYELEQGPGPRNPGRLILPFTVRTTFNGQTQADSSGTLDAVV
jgi:hypothetical protein